MADTKRILVTLRCEQCGTDLERPLGLVAIQPQTGAAYCAQCLTAVVKPQDPRESPGSGKRVGR